jgi:hypothetical protein
VSASLQHHGHGGLSQKANPRGFDSDILLLGYVIYQFFDDSAEAVHGILNAIFVHVFVTGHYIVAFIFAGLVAASVSTAYYR